MYCPVYGCSSDSQVNPDKKLHFFAFPDANRDRNRRKIWIEFCKRKGFAPTKSTCICSLHFKSDAYIPSHSPEFLKSIGFTEKIKCVLKNDAVPTENKPLQTADITGNPQAKRSIGTFSRRKVSSQ